MKKHTAAILLLAFSLRPLHAASPGFLTKPSASRDGNTVTISFAVSNDCDVAVSIEDSRGRILRHLAAGMLGENAPAPLQKGSRKQRIVWDGKRDDGTYVDRMPVTIRVSLGLEPRFEKSLLWSPYKRHDDVSAAIAPPLFSAAPEGVYVCDGGDTHHVRLYSHDGEYLRTIYPFPSARVSSVQGLQWRPGPDAESPCPLKQGSLQCTLLTSGDLRQGKKWPSAGTGSAATAMLVHGECLFLMKQRLNRLSGANAKEAPSLAGPQTCVEYRDAKGVDVKCPRSAAVSPDGKWLYLACFSPPTPYWGRGYLHAVMRVDPSGYGEPERFLGRVTTDPGDGADNESFGIPSSVACDRHGRVYVADYRNDRIQVFGADGGFCTSIPTRHPACLRIHPVTGRIYVFSWFLFNREETPPENARASLKCLAPLRSPVPAAVSRLAVEAEYDLDDLAGAYGRVATAEVDFSTDPPTVWFCVNRCRVELSGLDRDRMKFNVNVSVREAERTIHLFREQADRLVRVRKHDLLVPQELDTFAPGSECGLSVNPKTGDVYVGQGRDGFSTCLQVAPIQGRAQRVRLPVAAYDIAFHPKGYAYLRSAHNRKGDVIIRYDPSNAERWTEIPFNYGVDNPDGLPAVHSAITVPGSSIEPLRGGMAVSPHGRLVLAWTHVETVSGNAGTPRRVGPELYPGRAILTRGTQMIHTWSLEGKLVTQDALPGIHGAQHLAMDAHGNLLVLLDATRAATTGRPVNRATGTLVKAGIRRARLLSNDELAPLPLSDATRPSRSPDLTGPCLGQAWIEGAEWMVGGCGLKSGRNGARSGFALDLNGRCFVPRTDRYDVVVLDGNGNTIRRIGRYGNVDERDAIALFHPTSAAVHTDRRLVVADPGNARVLSVKLGYAVHARVRLGPYVPPLPE